MVITPRNQTCSASVADIVALLTPKNDPHNSLAEGVITEYEIPKSPLALQVNQVLLGIYHDERVWNTVNRYAGKFDRPITFAEICGENQYVIYGLGLALLPPKRMFLYQRGISVWDLGPNSPFDD